MAVEYTYRGEEGEVIPYGATRVIMIAKVVPAEAFFRHHNIEEVICSEDVEKIELGAFCHCLRLRKVVMPGVLVVEDGAFCNCTALTDVECDKLEIIGYGAFGGCESLRSINLSSVRVVKWIAFSGCKALTSAIFSDKLERIEELVFSRCPSLERITIPLKDGIITRRNIFRGCDKLKHVDLVEGEVLRETVAALYCEEWRNNMNRHIDSIWILPDTSPGYFDGCNCVDGEKARVIREWIERVLRKINHYKVEHRHVLDEAATALQHALPQDIVMNNVLPFLELPPYTFGVVEDEMEEDDSENDESESDMSEAEDDSYYSE